MAANSSPAVAPMRPGLIDPSKQAEYPLSLGEGFSSNRPLLNVRYNWKSKQIAQRQMISQNSSSRGGYKLAVREGKTEPYKYNGTIDPKATTDIKSVALVYDKETNAFTLEPISTSLNFNLTSADTKPNIDQIDQLQTTGSANDDSSQAESQNDSPGSDGELADPDNPYDYRHFLAEASQNAEAGVKTPRPGTPGGASPTPGSAKLLTAAKTLTPLQSPFMGPSTRRKPATKAAPRPIRAADQRSKVVKSKAKPTGLAKKEKPVPKSAERAESSDEGERPLIRGSTRKENPSESKRSGYMPSPSIIVDDDSGLTIDMGSPPPTNKRKHKINTAAFSGTSRARSPVSPRMGDRDSDGDVRIGDDGDVEDLALPSPRAERTSTSRIDRITQGDGVEDDADNDDDDDGLAAELEAVFGQDDDGDLVDGQDTRENGAVFEDEESEVSEEE